MKALKQKTERQHELTWTAVERAFAQEAEAKPLTVADQVWHFIFYAKPVIKSGPDHGEWQELEQQRVFLIWR